MVGICCVLGGDDGTPTEFLARSDRAVTRYSDREVAVYAASHPGIGTAGPYHVGEALVWFVGEAFGFDDDAVGGDLGHVPRPRSVDSAHYCARLYADHGPAFADGLNANGFALVYERDTGRVHLITDRLATLPVYHARADDGSVVFSTDVQELPTHPGVETAFDPDLTREYLAFGRTFGTTTPLNGVESLGPATVTTVDLGTGSTDSRRYWEPRYRPRERPVESVIDELAETLRTVLLERIERGREYGVLLSGGSASRLVLAALDADATAFHVADWMSREARTAERVALRGGHEFRFLRRDGSEGHAFDAGGELTGFDGPATHRPLAGLERHVISEVDVLLSGAFADALFGRGGIPARTVEHDRVGTLALPVERPLDSVQAYVGWLAEGAADEPVGGREAERILASNVGCVDGRIDHHGVAYASLADLRYCGEWWPLANGMGVVPHLSLTRTLPYRTPFLDARLVDLALTVPVQYRLRGDLVARAVERVSPTLAGIPDAESGEPLTRPFPVEYLTRTARHVWRNHLGDETPPRARMSDDPWTDPTPLREVGIVRRAIDGRCHLAREVPGLDTETLRRWEREHDAGRDRTAELTTALTLLSMPVVESVTAAGGDRPRDRPNARWQP
ncbi:asparagine synthase-related protein [Natronorarus salvus]|uniref:asparagine synthase-related protein n=1 Tax=Natronorarus salvus TaxID=3117733 RepID=UPI002F269EC9